MSTKNEGNFFVMLNHPSPAVKALAMIYTDPESDNENVARFETKGAARKAATDNPLGAAYGYHIFELGRGCQ